VVILVGDTGLTDCPLGQNMGLTDFELEEVTVLPHFSLVNNRNKTILVDDIDNLFCSLLVPGGIVVGKYVAVHHD